MTQSNQILAVMSDLFFAGQINDMAKRQGMTVQFLKDKETVLEKVRTKPALVIFDLNYQAADPIDIIRQIKGNPETRGIRIVGFVSHVQVDVKVSAQESGCDLVLARSAFTQNLPAILRQERDPA